MSPFFEWATQGRALAGERVSGDAFLVDDQESERRRVLLAVVDGLGHGAEAAQASTAALNSLRGHSGDVAAAFAACNDALAETRGAAMSIAMLDVGGALSWAGIGNVESFVLRHADGAREHLTLRGGVVGVGGGRGAGGGTSARGTPARVSSARMSRGDLLVLATDGVAAGGAGTLAAVRTHTVQSIADDVVARFAKATDDALVLVVRYLGDGGTA